MGEGQKEHVAVIISIELFMRPLIGIDNEKVKNVHPFYLEKLQERGADRRRSSDVTRCWSRAGCLLH